MSALTASVLLFAQAAAPATQPAPKPFAGCDPQSPENVVSSSQLLDLGERAVRQVRLAQGGADPAAAGPISPNFRYSTTESDLVLGSGEQGLPAFRRFSAQVGAGRYTIVVPEGLWFHSACFPAAVTVTFSNPEASRAQVITFTFERGTMVSASGRVTNAYRSGDMHALSGG